MITNQTSSDSLHPPANHAGASTGGESRGIFDSMKTYSEKLKDPRWQRKRLEIMERDEFKCIRCGDETKTLHVHHKQYRAGAEPWDYLADNFETLCKNCHAKEHGKEFVCAGSSISEFIDNERNAGMMKTPESRVESLRRCIARVARTRDLLARESEINILSAHFQCSGAVIRGEISKTLKAINEDIKITKDDASEIQPMPAHRVALILCRLASESDEAKLLLLQKQDEIGAAKQWVEGICLLEKIILGDEELNEQELMTIRSAAFIEVSPDNTNEAVEHAMRFLASVVLSRRDSAVKAALKEPGISQERVEILLEEFKKIMALMSESGHRSEYDDELPKSTYKPKTPAWKKKWGDK